MTNKLFNFIEDPKYQTHMEDICKEPFDLGFTSVECVNNKKHNSLYMYFYNEKFVKLINHNNCQQLNIITTSNNKTISTENAVLLGLIYVVRLSNHTTSKLMFNKTILISDDFITTFTKTIIKNKG